MEDNKIVETETTETITTDENVVETQPTDDNVEQTEKTFTQAEVDKFVESRVYKERDSIAKKLGMGDKYSKTAMDEFITNTSEAKTQLDAANSKYDELISEKNQIQEDYLVNKFNVDSDNIDTKNDFMTLVNSNLTADKTIEQSATEVAERLKGSNMFKDTTPSRVVIGTDKSKIDPTLKATQTQQEALRRL